MTRIPYRIAGTCIGAHIPGIQIDGFTLQPRAVAQTELQAAYAHNPIRRGFNFRGQRNHMMHGINAHRCHCFAVQIGKRWTACLDDCAYLLLLQGIKIDQSSDCFNACGRQTHTKVEAKLAFQQPGRAVLRVLHHCLAGQRTRLPETIVGAVRGTNKLAEACHPAAFGKEFRMQIARPDALEDQLEAAGIAVELFVIPHKAKLTS